MRIFIAALLAAVTLVALPRQSEAQYRIYDRHYGSVPMPYYSGPPVFNSTGVVTPYGYRAYSNTGIYPGPFGYNAYYSYGTTISPYVARPYHSIYWDPFSNSYRYTSGALNTPNYYYSYSAYPFPY